MKKLIFLLLTAVALACFVSAQDTARPPRVLTLEAALSGDSVDGYAVTPDTVPVTAVPFTAEPAGFQAVTALYNETAVMPLCGIMNIPDVSPVYRRARAVSAADGYYLRC